MDDQLLKKRLLELAKRAFLQGGYTFTGFLDMAQLSCAYQMEKEFEGIPFQAFGGTYECERQMLRFGNKDMFGYDMAFPITCIHVYPRVKKFADELTHRDFLGAIMNLGIERDTIGDISVKEKEGWLFCTETMADYLLRNLDKVKHTNVVCQEVKEIPVTVEREFMHCEENVSSERIDGIIAKLYRISRTESLELFQAKKIFLNGKLCENNSQILKKQDVVSIRGFGKFAYEGILYRTKKEKIRVGLQKYV